MGKRKEITAGEMFPEEAQRKVLLKLHLAWVKDLLELTQNATHRQFPREAIKYLIDIENMLSGIDIHEGYGKFVGISADAYETCNELFKHFMADEVQETIM